MRYRPVIAVQLASLLVLAIATRPTSGAVETVWYEMKKGFCDQALSPAILINMAREKGITVQTDDVVEGGKVVATTITFRGDSHVSQPDKHFYYFRGKDRCEVALKKSGLMKDPDSLQELLEHYK